MIQSAIQKWIQKENGMMEENLAFNLWLRQRRKLLDLTQSELAELVGCSTVSIRKLESSERKPSRQLAGNLARVLRVPEREHTAFVQFARSQVGQDAFSLPAWSTEQISWRGAQLPQKRSGPSEDVEGVILHYDLITRERPQMESLEDGRTLVRLQASGNVSGALEGQIAFDVSQILVPKPAAMDYTHVLPMQIGSKFKVTAGDDFLEGTCLGTMKPLMDAKGNGHSRVIASGQVIFVSKGLIDFHLNNVFVEYEVKMVEGIGTGASGQMQLQPPL